MMTTVVMTVVSSGPVVPLPPVSHGNSCLETSDSRAHGWAGAPLSQCWVSPVASFNTPHLPVASCWVLWVPGWQGHMPGTFVLSEFYQHLHQWEFGSEWGCSGGGNPKVNWNLILLSWSSHFELCRVVLCSLVYRPLVHLFLIWLRFVICT